MADDRVFVKCAWRLIPLMTLLFVVNYIDRVNVGFAALTMNKDLGFTPAIYGFGAGIFAFGYVLFQVPSNWMLERIGARRWIFCILAVWGLISASNAWVQDEQSFYAVRLLLGAAEAGFFPGMLLYLTYWFPQEYLGRYSAVFDAGIPLSFVIGGPLASLILGMDGLLGLRGWQWLFLLEGVPSFLLAFAVLRFLPDGPARASWLSEDEAQTIAKRLANDTQARPRAFWLGFCDLRLYVLSIAFCGHATVLFGILLWLPQIVQNMGFSSRLTALVVALPYLVAAPAMILWGRSSDLRGDRVWHVALAWLLAAAGLAVASIAQMDVVVLVALFAATIGILSAYPPLYGLVRSMLSGPAAASGLALFNAIGNLGGFFGPYTIGALKEDSGGFASSMAVLAAIVAISAAIVLLLNRTVALRSAKTESA